MCGNKKRKWTTIQLCGACQLSVMGLKGKRFPVVKCHQIQKTRSAVPRPCHEESKANGSGGESTLGERLSCNQEYLHQMALVRLSMSCTRTFVIRGAGDHHMTHEPREAPYGQHGVNECAIERYQLMKYVTEHLLLLSKQSESRLQSIIVGLLQRTLSPSLPRDLVSMIVTC